jgi:RNA polymerase sigma-70 factor (ECF subfamily)
MKQTKQINDLVKWAKVHDADAFTELMQLFMKDMYRTSIAILMNDADAADAIQDAILVCWEKMDTLRNPKYFKTWMTRILINKCYDILEQRKHMVSFEEYSEYEEPTAQDDANEKVKELLSVLDEKYRMPMMLFYGQGYKISEIAEIMHIPKSTVQTRLARGRNKLAAFYATEKESGHGRL